MAFTTGRLTRDEDDNTLLRRPLRGASILVADDDGSMRDMVARRLSDEGFDVHTATSGVDLLGELEQISAKAWPVDEVDLIIVDNRMPGITGLDAIRKLRAAHWGVPAILMTAFPSSLVCLEAETLGVTVLAKPFSLDTLTRATLRTLRAAKNDGVRPHPFHVPS